MPAPCDHVTSADYAARHNPAVYYVSLGATCTRDDVPLTLPLDLRARFTFIVPNVCNDMHSCPVSVGDAWLSRMVPRMLASSQYESRNLILFISFDENNAQAAIRVPTIVVAPSVPRGIRVGAPFSHYSLLKTTELLLHLRPLGAAGATRSMAEPFHL